MPDCRVGDRPRHGGALAEHGIEPIDLLVINLYPFAQATARPDCTLDDAIENIDIGGPAMLRAAAKNWQHVGVVIAPADYAQVLAELNAGGLTPSTKFALARKVFAHTAAYDGRSQPSRRCLKAPNSESLTGRANYPAKPNLQLINPHGVLAEPAPERRFYRESDPAPGTLARTVRVEPSHINTADADAAWECVTSSTAPPA
jgi:phosphoribosylaminoimidazolecarboxamide formyltransferase/IMP cyclohydrolase